jgi:hypothetical protein
MANRHRSHRRRRNRHHSKRRNPFLKFGRKKHYRRHRRNPSLGGFDLKSVLKLGAGAAVGGYATRKLTQTVLGASNTGAMGYVANAGMALALAWAAKKFMSGEIADGVLAGGMAATFLRIYSEKFSGVAQIAAAATGTQSPASGTSGLGDIEFSNDGLGMYIDGSGVALPGQTGTYVSVPEGSLSRAALPGTSAAVASPGAGMAVAQFKSPFAA